MNPQRYKKIKNIVSQVLESPTQEVEDLLCKLCGDDWQLRQEVGEWLKIDVDDKFLASGPIEVMPENITEKKITSIGRIKIEKLLAKGGMGEVYLGVDEVLKRQVAVKIMHAKLRLSSQRREAFLNEAQVLSSLQHPNICQVHDFFQDNDNDVLVLELIKGKTLKDLLDQSQIKNPLDIAQQIAKALTAAHERGITHRDLKPENIMLTHNSQVKILDFGLARIDSTGVKVNESGNANLTQISGTPGYMSPEQATGKRTTTATDIWSFGLILSELLSGKKNFSEEMSTAQLLERNKKAQIQIPSNLSNGETKLIQQMLVKNPTLRPTARDILQNIKHLQGRTKRSITALIITSLFAIVLFSTWKYTTDLQRERNHAEIARQGAEKLISFMLEDLHTGLRSVGQLNLLESTANQALDYFKSLDDKQLLDSQGQSAIALLRISEVLTDSGKNNDAINALEQAITIIQDASKNNPDDAFILYRLALIQYNLADLYKLAGRYKLAQIYLYKAVEIGQQLTKGLEPGKGPEIESETRLNATMRWRVLLRSMYLLADTFTRTGKGNKAFEILEKVAKVAKLAAIVNPELTINLADIQFKRCDTYFELQLVDVILQPCQAVLALDKALYNNNPDNYESHKNLLADYSYLANVFRLLSRFDEGIIAINEGIRLGDLLIDKDPKNVNTKNEYVSTLLAKGRLLEAMSKYKAANQLFTQAHDIIMPLAKDHEEITYLNHAFIALVHLGKMQQANNIATTLDLRGFKRRDFIELCNKHKISACMDSLQ